jgi:hypothetical protein
MLASGYTDIFEPEESFTFVPLTIICSLSRLFAANHDYLLPPTITYRFPRFPVINLQFLVIA